MVRFNPSNTIVVLRHRGTIQYLKELGIVQDNTPQIEHAEISDIEGKNVIGMLPYHLAYHAATVTVPELNIPFELRGADLTLEQVKQYAGTIGTYTVQKVL